MDGLTALPLMPVAAMLDYASVVIFALTGALVASRSQLDLMGFIFVAMLTAIGGGTVRDVLIGRLPVFWVTRPEYVVLIAAAAVIVFFTAHRLESRYRVLVWLDALALSVAVPAGVAATMAMGHGPVVVLVMGVITGTVGGLMRDVLCIEVPLTLKQGELYLTCAFAGAAAALFLRWAGFGGAPAMIGCGAVTFVLRAGTLLWGWKLPVYKARAPRQY